jgi:hypothetical protein
MSITDPLLQTYRHDDLLVDARWVTWDLAVFEVRHEGVDGVSTVSLPSLEPTSIRSSRRSGTDGSTTS